MPNMKSLVLILAALVILGPLLSSTTADTAAARTLPTHCADILEGDCDVAWQCIVLCFMELRDQTEYCLQHPTDPRCN